MDFSIAEGTEFPQFGFLQPTTLPSQQGAFQITALAPLKLF